jgi:holo-[acyl-carrier protein] synthase
MLRTGVDLLKIERLKHMKVQQPAIYERFLKRVYTDYELAEAAGKMESLAGCFTAKEATAKALQCGIGVIGWQGVEVLHGQQGEPMLKFNGKAAAIINELGIKEWSLSISHTQELAIAFVVFQ